ncbi:hypothetical protein Q31b_43540 [Novipirellula aureliae]|uniref:Uncharacterized protein n=1 Tax=Novipirellula aureliae TaxID=2527966 RepID=A0A5C6DRD2_9BACT|nr:hypothetical protein Q31b_43540 [Novipirellula aureliae]
MTDSRLIRRHFTLGGVLSKIHWEETMNDEPSLARSTLTDISYELTFISDLETEPYTLLTFP